MSVYLSVRTSICWSRAWASEKWAKQYVYAAILIYCLQFLPLKCLHFLILNKQSVHFLISSSLQHFLVRVGCWKWPDIQPVRTELDSQYIHSNEPVPVICKDSLPEQTEKENCRVCDLCLFCGQVIQLVSWTFTIRKTCLDIKFHQKPSVRLKVPAPCCQVRAAWLICEGDESLMLDCIACIT